MSGLAWREAEQRSDGVRVRDLVRPGAAPLSVWSRDGVAPQAIVLIGHGGSQHRRGEFVEAMAAAILNRLPAYVAVIDGPAHGDRAGGDPAKTRDAFVALWLSPGGGVAPMVADWQGALAAVRTLDHAADLPVAYYGVSMGTAYGVPLLAAEPAIIAAALGMWEDAVGGTPYLTASAPQVTGAIDFVHRAEDQFFTEAGARRLFDALGSDDKTFRVLAGPHEETPDQLDQAASFLVDRLTRAAGKPSAKEANAS